MQASDEISLKEYLHQLSKRVKDPPCIDAYDEFLIKVWDFFSLRVSAEEYYESHRNVAKSKRGPLPVSWTLLRDTWRTGGPPEQIITVISKRNFNELNAILGNLRKVLNRVRQKVPIGRVQQLDAHCLRWLTRQPGYSAVEKGGSRQEILGVVRVENYNTLENRVLKDFLRRCLALSTMYLRRYDKEVFRDHVNVKSVRRFRNMCLSGLDMPEFGKITDINEVPQPNYVLQQDRLYSKIWRAYCSIIRQEDVAEKLWDRRDVVDDLYEKCNANIELHCSPYAKFDTPLWVCELDGRSPILEAPIWRNEIADIRVSSPNPEESSHKIGQTTIVDFAFPWDDRDELLYPAHHPNARPILQNKHKPSLEEGETVSIREILRKKDLERLGDYFRQLYGLLGGSQWVILVPDHWESAWLESVIREAIQNVLPRKRVFLLWRSIAAVLGGLEKNAVSAKNVVVADGFSNTSYNGVSIRFMKEKKTRRSLPQRASVRLHGNPEKCRGELRFRLDRPISDRRAIEALGEVHSSRLCVGYLNANNFVAQEKGVVYSTKDEFLIEGVRRFLKETEDNKVSYFDERDALSLVVQNRAEEVEFKVLVEHEECSPGGMAYLGPRLRGGCLLKGSCKVSLNLLEGFQEDDAPLKTLSETLDEKAPEDQDMFFQAEMIPGQGLTTVLFSADFLKKARPLDMTRLEEAGYTKAKIEREMKRHFPPVMPFVEASYDLWQSVKVPAVHYMNHGDLNVDTELFYKPRPYFASNETAVGLPGLSPCGNHHFNPETMSPIDRLKRENVFGNAPGHEFPSDEFDWDKLFSRMASDYANGRNVIRLIAWTYQSENPIFENVREQIYRSYVMRGEPLRPEAFSFCANCYNAGDARLEKILKRALTNIASSDPNQNEYRLVYNVLQFRPETIEKIDSSLCERAFMRIYKVYNTTSFIGHDGFLHRGGNATRLIGYLLKCMLFLLHRRRYDPSFMLRSESWQPSGFLARTIPVRRYANGLEYSSQRAHEQLRESFLNYVRGHGTIEGIPMGD